MENLNEEMEQQLTKMESRVKKEEQSKFERSNLDIIWQMENKNKEIQALQARNQKVRKLITYHLLDVLQILVSLAIFPIFPCHFETLFEKLCFLVLPSLSHD